jgi:hypothetical protein
MLLEYFICPSFLGPYKLHNSFSGCEIVVHLGLHLKKSAISVNIYLLSEKKSELFRRRTNDPLGLRGF